MSEVPSDPVKLLTLLVELRCNSYCVFCGQREVDAALIATRRRLGLSVPHTTFGDTRGRYTLETATEALRAARADGYTHLSLQGGEPTIFPELPALVANARALGFRFIGVVTNGRKLCDPSFTDALVRSGLDGITISVLGADAEVHDALSAAPGSFDAMMQGLVNAAASATRLERKVVVNANVIVNAKNVDHLGEIVTLLAERGVTAATLHLVRFSGLASDPKVVSSLRFDGRRLGEALVAAQSAASRVGVSLNAHDVPVCLHPSLDAAQLRRIVEGAGVSRHRFQASAYSYDLDASHVRLDACTGCLVDRECRKLPAEYVVGDATTLFRPITAASLQRLVDDTLAALDPASDAAVECVTDLADSLDQLGRVADAGDALSPLEARLVEALDDLMLLAARRRDAPQMLRAFFLRAGLVPHAEWFFDESQWLDLATPLSLLAKRARALAPRAASSRARLRLGGLEIALEGAMIDDRFRIDSAAPVLPSPDGSLTGLALRLHVLTVLREFQPGREIAFEPERVTLVERGVSRQVYVALRPAGIEWLPSPSDPTAPPLRERPASSRPTRGA